MEPPLTSLSLASEATELMRQWPFLVGLVLIVYDYFLTLSTEIHLIWWRPKPWFFLIRYLALSANILMAVVIFGNFGPERHIEMSDEENLPSGSGNYHIRFAVLHILLQFSYIPSVSFLPSLISGTAILTLRVYALFNRNRGVLMLLSLAGLGSLAVGMWLGTTANPLPGTITQTIITSTTSLHCLFQSKHLLTDSHRAIRIAGAWEAELFRDVLIFALTLLRGILHWRRANYHSPFLNCFVLDGFVYFCLIALVDLANILVYYFGDPFLAGSLAWLASALSAVLIARLMLNMCEVVDTGVYGAEVEVVASEDDDGSVEWNIIDGTQTRGHVRNRASWGHADELE
ncbi:hypothetical protein B0H13DRAFT_2333025 [Mycena leptocephala]|nr:hypothetical protein B0H13DRAFT_2333025 [Mycena leptocephala]